MSDEADKVRALEAQIEALTRMVAKLEAKLDPPTPTPTPARPPVPHDHMKRVARIPDEAVRRMAEAVPTDLVRAIVRDNRGW
jgi:hypothetical protein